MGTVDQVDMQMSFSEFLQKSVKWYKEIAFFTWLILLYSILVLFNMRNLLNPFS